MSSNQKFLCLTYEEAINECGNFVGTNTWHDYMSGAFMPNCDSEKGIAKAISLIYREDVAVIEEQIRKASELAFQSLNKRKHNKQWKTS